MKEKQEDKLWEIKIGEGGDFYELYLISTQKPVFIEETAFGKFRRMFSSFGTNYHFPQLPIFYVSRGQEAVAKEASSMHGFSLQELTPQHIILSINNPQKKSLYEITLFNRKIKNFFRKEYLLAFNKKEALSYSDRFKADYQIIVKKAKKIDCYPIVDITEDRIILNRLV